MHKAVFIISILHFSTRSEHYVLIIRRSKLFQHIMLDHGPHPQRSREKKGIRDVSTFTAQHVRAATRSIKCERQLRHVALAMAGPMLVSNNMAAYQLGIINSVCPFRIINTCLMSVHTIYNNVNLRVIQRTIRSTCNIQLRETQMNDATNINTLQPSFHC